MKVLVLILGTLALSGCFSAKDGISVYQQEAHAFYEVHSPDYWIDTGQLEELNQLSPSEKQTRLIQEIRATISSEAMEKVIYHDAEKLSAREFYPYLQKKIPELTNEPSDCPAIEQFYVAD